MKIIPVIDLSGGTCVHAVRGERDGYQPVQSVLTKSTKPLELAQAMLNAVPAPSPIYIADLDAIQRGKPDPCVYRQFLKNGMEIIVDAGLTDLETAESTFGSFAIYEQPISLVAGLESLCGPECLFALLARFGPEKLIFSLDLYQGEPLGEKASWGFSCAFEIAKTVHQMGIERMIILDLSKIGTGSGIPTLDLCQKIRTELNPTELIIGGGIESASDLEKAEQAGANVALVATALHRGTIS